MLFSLCSFMFANGGNYSRRRPGWAEQQAAKDEWNKQSSPKNVLHGNPPPNSIV